MKAIGLFAAILVVIWFVTKSTKMVMYGIAGIVAFFMYQMSRIGKVTSEEEQIRRAKNPGLLGLGFLGL